MVFGKNFVLVVLIAALIILAINVNSIIKDKFKIKKPDYSKDPLGFFKDPTTWKWILLLGLVLLITGLILLYLKINTV